MPAKIFVDTNIWLYSLIQRIDGDDRHLHASDFTFRGVFACDLL
jgi:predicted nucleic acid-binding protein